jgi:tripartite-type tricarboxylate transporter receptor subunit TctC
MAGIPHKAQVAGWACVFALGLSLCAGQSSAQSPGAASAYPDRPVRILVGWAPGGGVDRVGRFLAQWFGEALGGSFVVDNRPGAASNIATDLVAKAKPDGYTLLATSSVHSINPSVFAKLPFDPVKDFTAIGPLGLAPNAITVHPSMPTRTLAQFVALAKARPGEIPYASAGGATLQHIGMEMFLSATGIKLLHVPYKGTGPSLIGVMSGEVSVISSGYGLVSPYEKAGKVRVLAIATTQRTALAPHVPTIAEAAGLPGFEAVAYLGLVGPAGMPAEIVNRLNGVIAQQVGKSEVRERLVFEGLAPLHESPAAFAKRIESDLHKYGKVVRQLGYKPE